MHLFGEQHNDLVRWLSGTWLVDGPQVAAIVGASGVGKTTVMQGCVNRLPDKFRVVVVDVPETEDNPLEDLVQELGKELTRLKLLDGPSPRELFYNSTTVVGRVTELLNHPTEGIVIVLDEFQRALVPGSGEAEPGFAEFLKPISRPPKNAGRLLLVTNRKLPLGEWTDPIAQRELCGLTEAGREMFDSELKNRKRENEVPENRRDDIVRWVAGNPRALKLIAGALNAESLDDLIGERPEWWEAREREVSPELLQRIEKGLFAKAFAKQPKDVQLFLLAVSVHRRAFNKEMVIPLLPHNERNQLSSLLSDLEGRYLITHHAGWYSLSEVGRDVCREKLHKENPRIFKKAHLIASDYYKRLFTSDEIEEIGRVGVDFLEACFHLFQAGRHKELTKISQLYCECLREKFTLNSPLPDDPAQLDQTITGLRNVLRNTENPDPVICY